MALQELHLHICSPFRPGLQVSINRRTNQTGMQEPR